MTQKTPTLPVRQYRTLLLVAGSVYLFWWFTVHWMLPAAFNPISSRLLVVAFIFSAIALSYISEAVRRRISIWFSAGVWLLTFHYFYLFHNNESDVNWTTGCYILVIAVAACFQSAGALLAYSVFTLLLSIGISVLDADLLRTVFLPGLITILIVSNIGLRSRLKLLDQLSESTLRFKTIFSSAFEGMGIQDQGVILDANESLAKIFGYPRDELLGKNVLELAAPESRSSLIESLRTGNELPYEAVGIKKDGSLIPIEVAGKPLQISGKVVRITAVNDLSERKKAERIRVLYEASRETIAMRDEFLSIASHELKTPLTSLKLLSEVFHRNLAKDDSDPIKPERVRDFLARADRQIERLIRLVEDMLDNSSISLGTFRVKPQALDFARLIHDVVGGFSEAFKKAGCSVELEVEGSATITGDPFRLEQVLVNLLTNAVKFGEGRPISVILRQSATHAVLTVEDRGIGIDKKNHERIFQRYERAISSRNIGGLGLGLYIANKITEMHQGKLEVESELGKGAQFRLTLPLTRSVLLPDE